MVKVKVDLDNREKLKRLHTATHVVNFCAREVLGNHIWQNGSNLKAEFGTLDITHYNNLSLGEIFEIERRANATIFANKKVSVEELDRAEAEKKYGFGLYQGGAIPMKVLRIISVSASDIEACGGLHMESTGGIGIVKIVESSKIQDGVVRLKFVVNDFALSEIENNQRLLSETCGVFSVEKASVVKTAEKFFNDWKEQKKEIERLKDELKDVQINQILCSKDTSFDVGDLDMGQLMEIFTKVMVKKKDLVLNTEKFVISSGDFKPQSFKKEINKGKFSIFVK